MGRAAQMFVHRHVAMGLAAVLLLIALDADAGRRRRRKRKKSRRAPVEKVVLPTAEAQEGAAPAVEPPEESSERPDRSDGETVEPDGQARSAAPAGPASGVGTEVDTTTPATGPAGVEVDAAPGADAEVVGPTPGVELRPQAERMGPRLRPAAAAALGLIVPMQGYYPVAAFKVRGDLYPLLVPITDRILLRAGGSAGFSFGLRSDDVSGSGSVALEQSVFTFDVLPAGRVEIALLDALGVYGVLGLGMVLIQNEVGVSFAGGLGGGQSSTNAAGSLRVALGGYYRLTDSLQVTIEPVAVDVIFWEHGAGSLYTMLLGATYAL